MPRILNAKQTATTEPHPIVPGRPYHLISFATNQQINTIENGTLTTDGSRRELWIFTTFEGSEVGTYHLWASGSAKWVVDPQLQEPVRTGPPTEKRIVVRVSSAGGDTFVIKAPEEDLVWTLVGNHIEYEASRGKPTQLWRLN